MKPLIPFLLFFSLLACTGNQEEKTGHQVAARRPGISLVVLGNVQDAGSPQIGCTKDCCKKLFENPDKDRMVVSLGIIDAINNRNFLIEATPDIARQSKMLRSYSAFSNKEIPDGIFLTHAHVGHYTGLMYLGKEAMNAQQVPVYAMPRMKSFLETSGPWSQLVTNNNIRIEATAAGEPIQLTNNLAITPFTVPHRDEFSETVGYKISGQYKTAIFIPDIDKWEKWDTNIIDVVKKADYVLIDATFFDAEEINNRDIATIPHPFIIESMSRFSSLPVIEKKKIYFIHFNHTNPLLDTKSRQYRQVIDSGYQVAALHSLLAL